MDKWERLKEVIYKRAATAKHEAQKAPISEARSMLVQEYTDWMTALEIMDALDEQESREKSRELNFEKDFIKFLDRGIGAKDWESTLKRKIRKFPDEADFLEGYTAALIEIKAYYVKSRREK